MGVIGCLMLLAPLFVGANNNEKPDRSQGVRSEIYAERHEFINERQKERLCRVFSEHTPLTAPAFCDDEREEEPEPEPEPDPEPEPEAPTLEFTATPNPVVAGGTTTLTWESEHASECVADDGWSGVKATDGSAVATVLATTTFTLSCTGEGGEVSKSVVIGTTEAEVPDEEPEPTGNHILIYEVFYDLANDGSDGSEVGGANEWVELYNPTNSAVDLANWKIGDGASNDVISDTTFLLGPDEYLLITNATTTANFWDLEAATVIYLGSSISGGLANGGDSVKLYNAADTLVDAMSYGTNVSAFDPSVPVVTDGSSLARAHLAPDTDTAADWFEDTSPTPGF